MVIVTESVPSLKSFIGKMCLSEVARLMVMRMVLAFILHRGRMSCSQGAGSIRSQGIHRGQLTRFLARRRWQQQDFNAPLRKDLLGLETLQGPYIFIIDATLVSHSGQCAENVYSTGNRQRRPRRGRRYNQKKINAKQCHSFTFGLLITPSGYRIAYQIPHYTKQYCAAQQIPHRTTAQSAAELIRGLDLPPAAKVLVLGDTAYDADVVRKACDERGYTWIVPANSERVYAGTKGNRPRLRSRLKDWTSLSLKTIRQHASTSKSAAYRRLSRWRVGPKQKPRVFYAYQEKPEVHRVGRVQVVFSTTKANLETATADDVKILMTNDASLSVSDVVEYYSLRWQIELFFKELKSTLGFSQYSFQRFSAVNGWVETAITTVLYLEYERAKRLQDRRLDDQDRQWWAAQRLHGLCAAVRQQAEGRELKYVADRLKTSGGIAKLKRILAAAFPSEYRAAG